MFHAIPRRPRPSASLFARRRRLGRRLAAGLSPAQAARAEGIGEGEVRALLAEPGFRGLVQAWRDLDALPEAAQRARLVRLARGVLEEALVRGDVRAALFVLREDAQGRDPAETLARGVMAQGRRMTAPAAVPRPAAAPPASAPRRRAPADPRRAAVGRGAAALRAELAAEHEARHAATAASAEPAPTTDAADEAAAPACAAEAALPARPTAATALGRAEHLAMAQTPFRSSLRNLPRRPGAP